VFCARRKERVLVLLIDAIIIKTNGSFWLFFLYLLLLFPSLFGLSRGWLIFALAEG
jgi:hypothetical protein